MSLIILSLIEFIFFKTRVTYSCIYQSPRNRCLYPVVFQIYVFSLWGYWWMSANPLCPHFNQSWLWIHEAPCCFRGTGTPHYLQHYFFAGALKFYYCRIKIVLPILFCVRVISTNQKVFWSLVQIELRWIHHIFQQICPII